MGYKLRLLGTTFLIFLSLLTGCSKEESIKEDKSVVSASNNSNTNSSAVENLETKNEIMSFKTYKNLFEHMDSNLKIDGFKLKESTIGPDVTAIDKDLSFGKREWLTVDGVMKSTDPDSTQETLYFENNNQTIQLAITFAYTESYIGKDMIQYQVNSGYNNLKEDLSNKTELIISSYKNVIITVQQTTNEKVDGEITKLALRKVIEQIKYF